jgi:hypothetical protein
MGLTKISKPTPQTTEPLCVKFEERQKKTHLLVCTDLKISQTVK